MRKKPRLEVVEVTSELILIKDLGPWDTHPTITNAVEDVVAVIGPLLDGRRLEYIDSEGKRDQILVRDGKFWGFALSVD